MAVAIKKKGEFSEDGKCMTKTGAAVLVAKFPWGWGAGWVGREVA